MKQGDFSLKVSMNFQTLLLNPTLGTGNPRSARLIYQPLVQENPYESYKLTGVLANDWKFNTAADELTVFIKEDALWADGSKVTAKDVKFTYGNYMNPPEGWSVSGAAKTIGKSISDIEVVDDSTVKLKLKGADVAFVSFMADPDAAIWPAHRTLKDSVTKPVGSGSFEVISVETDVKSVMVRNAFAWMKDSVGNPLPYLDGVETIEIAGGPRSFAAIIVGSVGVLNSDYGAGTMSGKEAEVRRRIPNATIQTKFGSDFGPVFRNVEPLNNPKFQKAINVLFDRMAVVELARGGQGVFDSAGLMPASTGNSWSLPMDEILGTPGYRYLNKKTGKLETDMQKIRQGLSAVYEKDPADIQMGNDLLKEIGMHPDQDGFPEFEIHTASNWENQAVVISGTLREYLGVDIGLDITDYATHKEKRQTGLFDVVLFAIFTSSLEPSQNLVFQRSTGALSLHGYELPELDALFNKQKAETDPVKRKNLIYEIQRKHLEGTPFIHGTFTFGPAGVVREWVQNYPMPAVRTSYTYSYDQVWYDASKR
ncbi:ABC transporter substrate-binding protein [Dehalococcoidia bacterium]|nr:ABC transporter substrate-binding protein [Dehalococcoidia bacterium]